MAKSRIKNFHYLAIAFSLLLCSPNSAFCEETKPEQPSQETVAQPPTWPKAKKEIKIKKKPKRLPKIKATLDTTKSQVVVEEEPEQPLPELEAAKLNAAENFIIPDPESIETDRRNSSRITTKRSWRRGRGGSCADPIAIKQMCAKSNAIKELLSRFTGNNDYYENHCEKECKIASETAQLYEIELIKESSTKLQFRRRGGTCRFKLSKNKDAEWLTLQASKTECTCLPDPC